MAHPDTHRFAHRDSWRNRSLTVPTIFLLLLLLDFPYQYGLRYETLTDSLMIALIDAVLYTGILFIATRFDLARVTLCFLALPYLIFIPLWLNTATATILMMIFIVCLLRTVQDTQASHSQHITLRDLTAFILILAWVNVSGIGGYGFQWADYAVNNARLHDLVTEVWPVHYGNNLNFVYYFGYFLPSAIVGKIFSVDLAQRSVYLWATLGVTLAIRWVCHLSKWPFSISLALAFMLFGSLDILNLFYIKSQTSTTPLQETLATFKNYDMDTLVFATSSQVKHYLPDPGISFFLGNYPGNSFQLYWSPQQLIAGWLCAGLLMHLFFQQQIRHIVFIYALLFLWGAAVMISLFPFAILIALTHLCKRSWHELFTLENTLGAGSLACVFVAFYLSGSAHTVPSFWLVNVIDWPHKWDLIVVFYLAAWGIYVLALIPFILTRESLTRIWFTCLVLALAILPLRIFGLWSDLLCRGSGPLMFILLIFLLSAIRHHWLNKQLPTLIILVCLFISGSTSAFLINGVSTQGMYYGQTYSPQPLQSYHHLDGYYENFGSDNSFFNRWFRAALPDQKPLE